MVASLPVMTQQTEYMYKSRIGQDRSGQDRIFHQSIYWSSHHHIIKSLRHSIPRPTMVDTNRAVRSGLVLHNDVFLGVVFCIEDDEEEEEEEERGSKAVPKRRSSSSSSSSWW